jgi:hypothetical protein
MGIKPVAKTFRVWKDDHVQKPCKIQTCLIFKNSSTFFSVNSLCTQIFSYAYTPQLIFSSHSTLYICLWDVVYENNVQQKLHPNGYTNSSLIPHYTPHECTVCHHCMSQPSHYSNTHTNQEFITKTSTCFYQNHTQSEGSLPNIH